MPTAQNKRERARRAQERSRARRKADLARLQAKVASTSNAIDEMTGIFLEFSEAMLADSGAAQENAQRTSQITEFMRRFLAVARPAAELLAASEDTALDVAQPSSPETPTDTIDDPVDNSRAASRLALAGNRATIQTFSDAVGPWPLWSSRSPVQYSPRQDYSLWADYNTRLVPADIRPWVAAAKTPYASFATRLFWNALHLGHDALSSPDRERASLGGRMFKYSLKYERRAQIVGCLRRRMVHTPPSVPITVTSTDRNELWGRYTFADGSSFTPLDSYVDLETDRQFFLAHHRVIMQGMSLAGDSQSAYLDAAAVQTRLSHVWGFDMSERALEVASSVPESQRIQEVDVEREVADPNERPPMCVSSGSGHESNPQTHAEQRSVSTLIDQPWVSTQQYTESTVSGISSNPLGFEAQNLTPQAAANLWSTLIFRLAFASRCMGNGIGFPIKAVDEIAQSLLISAAA